MRVIDFFQRKEALELPNSRENEDSTGSDFQMRELQVGQESKGVKFKTILFRVFLFTLIVSALTTITQ